MDELAEMDWSDIHKMVGEFKMIYHGYINTIADLERETYGVSGFGGISNQLLKAQGGISGIHAGHDVGSAPSGINANLYNLLYGQKVWSMLNKSAMHYQLLLKDLILLVVGEF